VDDIKARILSTMNGSPYERLTTDNLARAVNADPVLFSMTMAELETAGFIEHSGMPYKWELTTAGAELIQKADAIRGLIMR
jgi:predicted transcriptional regulator